MIAGIGGESVFDADLASGALTDRLRENTPTADMVPPVLVAQGAGDEVIDISINEEGWVPAQCAAGYELDFRTYPGLTHMGVLGVEEGVESALPDDLIAWTEERLAGRPATSTC